jgi:molecular chaperone DnaK
LGVAHSAIGIDLGTTYSALAVINPAGKPEIVPNAEGERITASAVYFENATSVKVGQLAVEYGGAHPHRVVRWVKRWMGDPVWRFEADGVGYRPEDISAMVLRKVKQDAELVLGPIQHAVVTVPAYFDEVRRKATMDAASKAGLDVLRIINEPTAAALAYAAGGRLTGRALIYDFGGGTFDVTIVDIKSPHDVEVITSEGDHDLGGYNLDEALARHFDQLFFAGKGVHIYGDDIGRGDKHRLLDEAERTKRALSSVTTKSGINLQWGTSTHTMSVAVDRRTFESVIAEHLVRTEMLIENALSQANCAAKDIDAVVLVGGSTRIPAVQEMLRRKFNKEPVRGVNPDEAVALGAAIQAGIILQQQGKLSVVGAAADSLNRMRLQDVTNWSYGTIAVESAFGREQLRNTILIPKNTKIPCSKTESFCTRYADQREIRCTITQAQADEGDPNFVNVIAEGVMELAPDRPAGCEIQVTYTYDANQRMHAQFKDMHTGQVKQFDLDLVEKKKRATDAVAIDENSLDDLVIS